MTPIRIFISSLQREFARERAHLLDYLRGDPLMRRFFEVFLFEDVPASDRRPDEVYLNEVERCDIYVGLFGHDYGFEDAAGVSPTEREFDRATELEKHRLIFVWGAEEGRHPKMHALIGRAQAGLVRRRFATSPELVAGLYAALLQYLEAKELLRFGPFDAAQCAGATLDDLDTEGMYRFIRMARRARQFSLPEETPPADLLRHLNLLNRGRLTNAAVLLFGRAPQRFLISSEVKCASLPRYRDCKADSLLPSLQGHGLRACGPGRGLRPEQDCAVGGHEGGECPGTCGVRGAKGRWSRRLSSTRWRTGTTPTAAAFRSCSSRTGWKS